MPKSLQELWAERPPSREHTPEVKPHPNHIIVGGVSEVRRKAREESPANRLQKLYRAAKRAHAEATTERERADALWVLDFVSSTRRKLATQPPADRGRWFVRVGKTLQEKESQYAAWMS